MLETNTNMPSDKGPASKSSKIVLKKESNASTPRKESKGGNASSSRTTKGKEDGKRTRESSLSRVVTNKKEDSSRERVPNKSRVDAEKLRDVKRDLEKDLSKAKETLAKNRTSRSIPLKQTATRALTPVKASLDIRAKKPTSNATSSVGSKSSLNVQPVSRKVPQTSQNKSKVSNTRKVDNTQKEKSNEKEKTNRKTSKVDNEKGKSISSEEKPKKLSRERTRTRTLSPHEVKVARGISPLEVENTHKSRGTDESSTMVFPSTSYSVSSAEVSSSVWNDSVSPQVVNDAADNYEDDFEDYESDFEEDIPGSSEVSDAANEMTTDSDNQSVVESNGSDNEAIEFSSNRPVVEEEKKMDSGNYDLSESKRKNRELQQIKEALEKENSSITSLGKKSSVTLARPSIAQDEGFEEEKVDEPKTIPLKKTSFINFASAKKKMEEQKVNAKTRKRGEELLNMIRLDTVNFSLLDFPPVPYEVYIKSYGRSNTQQVYVQTNEDNLSEEIQTDDIPTKNKWTQHPVTYHPVINEDNNTTSLDMYSQDHLGVGGDIEQDPDLWKKLIKYDAIRLNRFLLSAGQAMLQLLEQQTFATEKKLLSSSVTSFFSKGFFNLDVNEIPFLTGRSISLLCFSDVHPTVLLTVHGQLHDSSDIEEPLLGRCMLCVWNILKPCTPEKILVCSDDVASVCFHSLADNLVFGGMCDGTVCVWDLQESAAAHCLTDRHVKGWVIRSPTYSTAEILKDEGHLTNVIRIQAVGNVTEDSNIIGNDLSPIQVCSIELTGVAIIWTVIQSKGSGLMSDLAQQDLGLAHWGKVRLVRSMAINVFEGLDLDSNFLGNVVCQDMCVDPVDSSQFYVCTNSGHAIRCLSSGCKPHPKMYCSSEGSLPPATCIDTMCVVNLHFLLVGFEGGIMQLYSRSSSKPLATYSGTGDSLGCSPAVKVIQWFSAHPGYFFVLDQTSRIHLWNLLESDILPIKTFAFQEEILSMKLSENKEGIQNYLAIATKKGEVQIYEMKPEFSHQSPAVYDGELKRFIAYTKLL